MKHGECKRTGKRGELESAPLRAEKGGNEGWRGRRRTFRGSIKGRRDQKFDLVQVVSLATDTPRLFNRARSYKMGIQFDELGERKTVALLSRSSTNNTSENVHWFRPPRKQGGSVGTTSSKENCFDKPSDRTEF